jgi:DNA-binding transcriptional LysR family regulator
MEMGGKLFERTTRSVELTTFGESMMGEMRGILDAKTRLLVDSSEYLARDDRNIRIGVSPLINDDFVATLLSRIDKLDAGLNIILSEMNKADIQPALAAGEIDYGLGPGPWVGNTLASEPIYSEPLLSVSDVQNGLEAGASTLSSISEEPILLVGEDCGLSIAVRSLFRDHQTLFDEYEGKALSYSALEKWAHLGMGTALLPASKVVDLSRARRLNNDAGTAISISFHVCWKPSQEHRSNFGAIMKALQTDIR